MTREPPLPTDEFNDGWEEGRHSADTEAGQLRAEVERLKALVEDALRGLHNDFEPDNQSALYNRIKAALEPKP
jgi:hypothetical protein